MSWMDEVNLRLNRKNKVLFSKDSPFLCDLNTLIRQQNHRTIVLWALEFAEEIVWELAEKYPEESRPRSALEAARLWASGKIKMPEAQREILNCHALAKELPSPQDRARCHAVGQACSTVHTIGHAIGLPLYELTAIIHRVGVAHCAIPVKTRKREYMERLLYWQDHCEGHPGDWADFMLR